ncbi:hypothetical protein CERSUDRAFT_84717 [Gelatoporia subvermispora B]|uniref:alcohol dehydrogenase n=1 Tax=Ceriporiopsis subvermispora (strain B) TaxID=914234 RepID=M2QWN2_CERS8|nr:hypothetical protein CERSUDRAFT_84717 [Gelatoporia subvermispora B]
MSGTDALSGRAAVIKELGLKTITETVPAKKQPSELSPGECLVKLEYSGVCHSDLHFMLGEFRAPKLPHVGGHEGVGHIIAIGEHTGASAVKVGDRVGIKWILDTCMQCEMCLSGAEQYCEKRRLAGFTDWGTFGEYVVAFVNHLVPIPENVPSPAAAPILCAGVTVYTALKVSHSNVGDWVTITGAGGGLGHLAVQYAVAMGLRVIAIDSGEDKKKVCLELGAEKWIDFKESKDMIQDVRAAADGIGPHTALIATGTQAPYIQASLYLRPGGKLLVVGLPAGPLNGLLLTPIAVRGIQLIGTALGSRKDVAEALALVARGKVTPHYQVVPLDQINTVLEEMQNGKIVGRVVLQF